MGIETPTTNEELEATYDALKRLYKIAKKRDDVSLMLDVSERLMALYAPMSEVKRHDREKQKPAGFTQFVGVEDD